MTQTGMSSSETLYASADFMVENYPDLNAAEIIHIDRHQNPPAVRTVTFRGMDALMFLGGFQEALHNLPEGEVETEYLSQYSPLMQRHLLH